MPKKSFFVISRDVSERMHLKDELQHVKEQLEQALLSAYEFIWNAETDINGSVRFKQLSSSFEKIAGYPPNVFLDNEKEWLSIVHQEDQDSVQDAMTRRVVDGSSDKIEYRIILPDGLVRWVRDIMCSRRITENRVRMDGIINDITDRKRAEEKMQQANEQLVLWVNELKQRNSEATLLNEMGDLLQSCVAIENVYMIVMQFGVELFPEQSGALYILEPNVNLLEVVSTWGNNPASETEF
ncbi:MAG: PAS domain-containing protein, partial [Anaerolineaceae bacterium]|nr:PAS domain-containing protein [Anaerolineaceae bacterium]